ncbi:hypothetical protein GH723_07580 [Actinomarinicola tropica]|uniref:Glucose/Sorbosone dehydrogenase domain-containing protein n=1 Tax=Actinomarinicola tropica TaxID=2789776 RepID=A0A5Q2RR33_9ACTN|nr:hypothetical protein GH723_07580 [Actinomarinicola tropica]
MVVGSSDARHLRRRLPARLPLGELGGRLAVASLKDSTLRLFTFAPDGRVVGQEIVPQLNGTFGRLRAVDQAPDGSLYVTTSNGSGDRVLRITAG